MPLLLVTNNNLPVPSVTALIAAANTRPGKLTQAAWGVGQAAHGMSAARARRRTCAWREATRVKTRA